MLEDGWYYGSLRKRKEKFERVRGLVGAEVEWKKSVVCGVEVYVYVYWLMNRECWDL